MTSGTFYIGYHTFSPHNKPAVYTQSVTLSLKWKPHRNELYFSLFMAGMDTQKPRQLLLTYSALQLAVEYMPECTDPLKIKNTASHIISGDRTVSYSTGIWFISQE